MTDHLAHPRQHHSTSRDPIWRLMPHLDGTSSKVVTVLDEKGLVRYQSRSICHLLGLRAEQCVGRPLWGLLREESQEAARKAVRQMAENEAPFGKWRFCFQSASGGKRWLTGKAVSFLKDPRLGGIVVSWEPAL